MSRTTDTKSNQSSKKSENTSDELSRTEELVARFNMAQKSFLEAEEYMDYYWSLDDLKFEVTHPRNKLVYPLIPVGTWSPMTEEFTWAFAVPHFPDGAKFAAARLKGLGKKYDHPEYDNDHFDLSHMDLDNLLACAHDYLETKLVFKEKNMTPWLFFALAPPKKEAISTKSDAADPI